MKRPYIFLIIIAICIGGYYFGLNNNKPKNEIWIGYNYTKIGKNVISFIPVKVESKTKLKQLEEIFLYSQKLEHPTVDLATYDVQLTFRSPVEENVEYSSLLWFTKSGAVIKINAFNGYRSVGIENAKSIKKIINYTEL
ncbi:hypothetical protein [Bacillus sp. AFS041924]|uniref:hypothetical protein n=1 Tax=Bacillus sp. AFS041924 TaxID=2033503 RepID=UPI000BFD8A8A|nr:hypothetical protein [Bacillus sp. AFS041924]PGS49319.1 hypothetical protein COC46_15605 [Bacillus sp. AFS041924]